MEQHTTMATSPTPTRIAPTPTPDERRHAALLSQLEHLVHEVVELRRVLHEGTPRLPDQITTTLNASNPLRVKRLGYRYLRLFASSATTLTANTAVGLVTLPVSVGWNNLDLPEDTQLTSAANVNVIIQRTDYPPVA